MKLQHKLISGVLVTMAVGASVVGAQTVTTTTGSETDATRRGPLTWEQRVDGMQLVDNGDYAAWQQYMIGNGRQLIAEKVTAEDFAKMAELFDAIKAGDYATAKTLGKDLKMPFGLGMGPGMGKGGHRGNGGKGEILTSPQVLALSAEIQSELKAAHEAGNGELVRQILEENGIKPVGQKFKDRWNDDSENETADEN